MAVGTKGVQGIIAHSSDGIHWTTVSPGATNGNTTTFGSTGQISAVAFGNGIFVAGGWDGKMAYSKDGIQWTAIPPGTENGTTTTFVSDEITCIAYGDRVTDGVHRGGIFVAASQNRKIAYAVVE